jgi:ABC-2 type transport system ATP-binding protein/lipopolysaccharide transport system ATP-binding protein
MRHEAVETPIPTLPAARVAPKPPVAVRVDDLSVRLSLQKEAVLSLRETVIRFLKRQRVETEEFWPLRSVSFEARRGEVYGIVGRNGAGKSTLLKVVAGVIEATKGRVEVAGRVAPLLELGAGFDQEMTGRENIFLYGSLLGFPRRKLVERFSHIVEFAELEPFVDVPLKNYSSGMISRLGFAVATDVDADVLIVDEALTVGDARFQLKCMERIESFRRQGVTILFVSHNSDQIRQLCENVLWLERGEMRMAGPVGDVMDAYTAFEYEPTGGRAVSWPKPEAASRAAGASAASVAYRAPGAALATPPITGDYDFVDVSYIHTGTTDFCEKVFGGRGITISNDPAVVAAIRESGRDATTGDIFDVDFPDDYVRYVSLIDTANLMPSVGAIKTAIATAARWARDFVFIRMPSYEDEAYLRALGLKFFWHDWTNARTHPRLDQMAAILQSLGLEQYHVSHREPIVSSEAPSILPVDAPPDQGFYDAETHGAKPSIMFPRPIYGQIDIFVALRPLDTEEWHRIIKRATQS